MNKIAGSRERYCNFGRLCLQASSHWEARVRPSGIAIDDGVTAGARAHDAVNAPALQ